MCFGLASFSGCSVWRVGQMQWEHRLLGSGKSQFKDWPQRASVFLEFRGTRNRRDVQTLNEQKLPDLELTVVTRVEVILGLFSGCLHADCFLVCEVWVRLCIDCSVV